MLIGCLLAPALQPSSKAPFLERGGYLDSVCSLPAVDLPVGRLVALPQVVFPDVRIPDQFLRRALCHDLPLEDHVRPVTDLERLGHLERNVPRSNYESAERLDRLLVDRRTLRKPQGFAE
jgi:hypothetical protein